MKKAIKNDNIDRDVFDFFLNESKSPKEELMSLTLTSENKNAAYDRYEKALALKNANGGDGK